MRHLLLVLVLCGLSSAAETRPLPLLHPLFSDHAVLQRDRPLPIWGWAEPGAVVAVSIAGRQVQTTAATDGRWEVRLDPLPASTQPLELVVTSGTATAKASDLLVGDVWICSGQSNMQMGVGVCSNAQAEIANADLPTLRLCWVRPTIATSPQTLVDLDWKTCSPATLGTHGNWGGFSATAYYFGRKLVRDLDIPIGLVHASWGGTPAQAWVSADALATVGDFAAQLADLDAYRRGNQASLADRMAAWWIDNDPGTAQSWQSTTWDDNAWPIMELPRLWEQAGLPAYDGIVWFRRTIDIPSAWAGRELTLSLGPIDDRDTTFFDGVAVGSLDVWNRPRVYRIPADLATAGSHCLATRVLDTGIGGGFHGAPTDMTLAPSDEPAAAISLAGPWRYQAAKRLDQLKAAPVEWNSNPNGPTVLFNGMIHPLLPAAVTGFTWYQGESNAGAHARYAPLLTALISDWRTRFAAPDGAFLIVQLASFYPRSETPIDEAPWPFMRATQDVVARMVPRCGLAVAIDIGDGADIHPTNKQDVGLRLALAALQIQYGLPVEGSGPRLDAVEFANGTARVRFTNAAGLTTIDGQPPLAFALAGSDGIWHHASARIDGETVVLTSPTVAQPTQARYAWKNNPAVNLVNGAGLPAVPFTSP